MQPCWGHDADLKGKDAVKAWATKLLATNESAELASDICEQTPSHVIATCLEVMATNNKNPIQSVVERLKRETPIPLRRAARAIPAIP